MRLGELLDIPELVAVFPLPNVVLLPGSAVPLHIFEPRYRAMVADALLGERTIAIALLKPGYEPLYHTLNAPIHSVVGVGRIADSASFDDGTYNIVLRGEARATVVEEFAGRPYRFARVRVQAADQEHDFSSDPLRSQLCSLSENLLADSDEARRRWKRLFASRASLAELTDLMAAALPVSAEARQALLAEGDPRRRADMILVLLHGLESGRRSHPLTRRPHQN